MPHRSTLSTFLLLCALGPVAALGASPQRTVSVTGEGVVSVAPDRAIIHAGVISRATEAQAALAANSADMARVLGLLRRMGVADADLQTTQVSVSPVYSRDAQGTSAHISGYEVSNQVRAQVRRLADLGKVLDALVEAGTNQLSGITFELGDAQAAVDEARRRAMADARRRAELYADAAQARLGPILSVSEAMAPEPPHVRMRMATLEQSGAVPVAPGEEELRAIVHVVYTLQD